MKKYFLSLIILFILDRLSKVYSLKKSSWGGFFDLHLNTEVAFSLPVEYFILYPLIIIILFVLSIFWWKSWQAKSILVWPWGLLIIGALSNLLDRIQYGGVIDFISVPYFAIFNISDIYISIAVIWIICYEWLYKKSKDD